MESPMGGVNNEPARVDVAADQTLTDLDAKIIKAIDLINKLDAQLSAEQNPAEKQKIEGLINSAKGAQEKLLDEKFAVAEPPKVAAINDDSSSLFDRAMGGERIDRQGAGL
jgi:hypothetical protein